MKVALINETNRKNGNKLGVKLEVDQEFFNLILAGHPDWTIEYVSEHMKSVFKEVVK